MSNTEDEAIWRTMALGNLVPNLVNPLPDMWQRLPLRQTGACGTAGCGFPIDCSPELSADGRLLVGRSVPQVICGISINPSYEIHGFIIQLPIGLQWRTGEVAIILLERLHI